MNRILLFGPKTFDKRNFIESILDENKVFQDKMTDTSQAGLILENLTLKSKYYTANIVVFIDEPDEDNVMCYQTWLTELLDSETRELRDTLQLIILVFKNKTEYELCQPLINKLNAMMDDENPPQWDGETVIVLADSVDHVEEESECEHDWLSLSEVRQSARLVNWREMEKTFRPLRIERQEGDLDLDTALAILRDAKKKNKGEITDSDKALVNSIIDSLLS